MGRRSTDRWDALNQDAADAGTQLQRRAPTLLRRESVESQGPVQVWAPDPRRVKRELVRSAAAFLVDLLNGGYLGLNPFIPAQKSLIPARSAWERPRALAADEDGFAITRRGGTAAARWDEIPAVWQGRHRLVIVLFAPHPVELNLYGYDARTRCQICALILKRTGLQQDACNPHLWRRPEPRPPSP